MDKLVCVTDFEQEALQRLDQNTVEYYQSGADDEVTLAENTRAFQRLTIRPRVLRDVSHRSMVTTVLGKPVGFPIGIAPTGMQKLCHEDGELGAARAAAALGAIYVLSTMSTAAIEEVASAHAKAAHESKMQARRWFQLYVCKDRKLAEGLVRRAEKTGFEALVLTVDAPFFGKRRPNVRNKFGIPSHLRLANFEGVGSKSSSEPAFMEIIDRVMDQSLTWTDVRWLKSITKLPIVVKGILTAEDARLALEHGVDAIWVSNHGGRQLDTVAPSIDVLEEVVDAVRGRGRGCGSCEVYLDGGVRTGTDVFKAIALGASMVFAGRPFLWGLTVGGEAGVRRVLEVLRDELDLAMSLAGVSKVEEIGHEFIGRLSLL